MPEDPDILSEDDFHKSSRKVTRRRNTALNKLGSVDICTGPKGEVFAVVRRAELTDEIREEIAPLLATARATKNKEPGTPA